MMINREPTDFEESVYKIIRKVPAGKVTTYKEIGKILGTHAYRAVGQALKKNPYAPETPCHRVVQSNGKIGGFMGKKSGQEVSKKIELLYKEGVMIVEGRVVNFKDKFWRS